MSKTNPKKETTAAPAQEKPVVKPGPVIEQPTQPEAVIKKSLTELPKEAEPAKPKAIKLWDRGELEVNADSGASIRNVRFEELVLAGATPGTLVQRMSELSQMKTMFEKLMARDLVNVYFPVVGTNFITKHFVLCIHHTHLPLKLDNIKELHDIITEQCVFDVHQVKTMGIEPVAEAQYLSAGKYEEPKEKK